MPEIIQINENIGNLTETHAVASLENGPNEDCGALVLANNGLQLQELDGIIGSRSLRIILLGIPRRVKSG